MNESLNPAVRMGWVRKWKIRSWKFQHAAKPTTRARALRTRRCRSSSRCSRNVILSGLGRAIAAEARAAYLCSMGTAVVVSRLTAAVTGAGDRVREHRGLGGRQRGRGRQGRGPGRVHRGRLRDHLGISMRVASADLLRLDLVLDRLAELVRRLGRRPRRPRRDRDDERPRADALAPRQRGDGRPHLPQRRGHQERLHPDGRVVYAASNDPDERLGEDLLLRGKITVRQYLEASKLIRPGRRLGAILLELRAIEPEDLMPCLEHHVKEMLLDVFTWTRGEYELVMSEPGADDVITLNFSMENLILEGIRRIRAWSQVICAASGTSSPCSRPPATPRCSTSSS